MSRPSCKKAILAAAESIVIESGAAHLTLDAVAERCGISKGGLIYHFPTKESLLQGMIGRLEEKIDTIRENVRKKFPDGDKANELAVDISMMRGLSREDYRLSAALLAVIAFQPELMNPFRAQHHKRFEDMISNRSFTRSSILFFAAMGLHFHQLLNISIVDNEQRTQIFDELLRLAESNEKIVKD